MTIPKSGIPNFRDSRQDFGVTAYSEKNETLGSGRIWFVAMDIDNLEMNEVEQLGSQGYLEKYFR